MSNPPILLPPDAMTALSTQVGRLLTNLHNVYVAQYPQARLEQLDNLAYYSGELRQILHSLNRCSTLLMTELSYCIHCDERRIAARNIHCQWCLGFIREHGRLPDETELEDKEGRRNKYVK